jgi:hypothetical protein
MSRAGQHANQSNNSESTKLIMPTDIGHNFLRADAGSHAGQEPWMELPNL